MAAKEPSYFDAVPLPSIAVTSPTVIVKVGAEGKEYILHTELLKHHSGYFRGALAGAFREAEEGVIPITDIDTDAFDAFVDWIYRSTLNTSLRLGSPKADKGSSVSSRTYILADRLLVPGLKSALMDIYFEFFLRPKIVVPRCRMIVELFGNLPESDPLLRFVVDIWVTRKAVFHMIDCEKVDALDLPQDFLTHHFKSDAMKKNEAPRTSAVAASETVVIVFKLREKQKRYTIHKRLLTYHSGYFRSRLADGSEILYFPELGDFDTMDFDILVDWMYERSLPSLIDMDSEENRLNVYLLAENLSIGTLKNALMDSLFDWLSDGYLSASNVDLIFQGDLPKDDPLIRLAVDAFCYNEGVEDIIVNGEEGADHLPQEFLVLVLRKMHHLSKLPEADRKLKREDYKTAECVSPEDKDGE
ncbi:hypothetical protein J4E93_002607 [Alternaria ventricosa]|uniref:uncharacterized protein n=1 Tax=Alternaria ventricosa TaxID=1187951 RepID=UPI0020C3EFA2|nr:uncharacterized protein J4E93_002607 [Alternaria ventricosa]KAI4652405.1 hypothetical protein J4E93_002607 [Alternaria ventricosa]